MIAILYIDPRGPYPALTSDYGGEVYAYDGVSIWSDGHEHQNAAGNYGDARKYDGPDPVIAHPPCRHWSRLRHLANVECSACGGTFRRTDPVSGGEMLDGSRCPDENCKGIIISDRDCAPRAVEQVRKFGGVLEHPARSKLWEACGLPKPQHAPSCSTACVHCFDDFGGYTIELDQCEWGHVARKRTWLYLVGVPRSALEAPPYPGREPTHDVSRDAKRARRNGYTKKRTSSRQNLLTPQLFAEYLIRLARAAGEARKVA